MSTRLRTLERQLRAFFARLVGVPALFARVTLGVVFVESGWGKLHNLEQVTDFFYELGIPLADVQAPLVSAIELLGGVALLLGFASRLAALPLIAIMGVAILTAKLDDLESLSDLFGFIEWLYIGLLVVVLVDGPGGLSIDRQIQKRRG